MKRIFQLCLFFLAIFLTKELSAQGTYSVTPNPMCYNVSNTYTGQAAYLGNAPASAASLTWAIIAPAGSSATITSVPGGAPISNTLANISFNGCGTYTIVCIALSNVGAPVATLSLPSSAGFACVPTMTILNNQVIIACPNGAGYANGSTAATVCANSSNTITPNIPAATSYTWSTGTTSTSLTSSIVVTPSVNTCYSYTAQLATCNGTCLITPTNQVCLSVESVTGTISPAQQTMCANSPISFTVNTTALGGTVAIPGTAVTGYSWYPPAFPLAPAVGTTSAVFNTLNINPGTWTCVVHHTNAAIPGGCTTSLTAVVATGTNISMSITPSSPSVCPNGNVTLTAVSAPTTATAYTWTAKSNTGIAISSGTGNPKSFAVGGGGNFPWTYTVDVNYGGCPGTATITIGRLALTPTITASSNSICPGTAVTLTATGGVNYTFVAIASNGFTLANPVGVPPASVVTHVAPITTNSFPLLYVVQADSAGCVGTGSLTVSNRTLFPQLSLSQTSVISSGSVCPLTQFTLSAHGVGSKTSTPTTYTFVAPAPFTPTLIGTAGQTNTFVTYTPTSPVMPKTYTVLVDSAGCKGTATATVNLLTMNPQLTVSSPSVCPGTSVSITSTNTGAGTNYTFMANDFTASTPPFNYTVIAPPGTVNHAEHYPAFSGTQTPVTYSVHVDSAGCVGNATINVSRLDLANNYSLVSSPANRSICPTTSIYANTFSLMVTGTSLFGTPSFTYIGPSTGSVITSGTSTMAQVPSPTLIPGSGSTYTVLVKDSTCVGVLTINMVEHKLHPTISITPTLVCAGMPVTVTAGGVAQGTQTTNVNYTFYQASGTSSQTPLGATSISLATVHNPTAPTVYSVSVDSSGCTGVLPGPTTSVAIRPALSLTTSASSYSVCPGLTSTLTVAGPVGNTSITYSWSAPGGASITPAPPSPSAVVFPTVATTYSVHGLDSLGCIGDTVITIGIDPGQSFTLGLANSGSTVCLGQSVTLSASTDIQTLGGSGTYSYTWSPTIGLTPLSGIGQSVVATANASMVNSIVYTVVASNPYGCVATQTITLPISQYPNITFLPFPSNVICPGFTSTLTALGGNTYTWTGPGTYTSPVAQQSIAVSVPGVYSVIVSNGGGCTNTSVYTINAGSNLTITASASSQTTCINSNFPKLSQPVHLTAGGATSFVWFPYDPLHMTYSLGPQTDVTPAASTCYTVVGSTSVCSGSTTICVNVIPQFTMEVIPSDPAICLGDSIPLKITNVGTGAVGPVSAFTYSWSEALNAPPISLTEYFASSTIAFPQNTTTYTVEMKDSRQCISMPRLITMTVNPRPLTAIAIPTINGVATNTVCFVGNNPGAIDVTINLIAHNVNPSLPFGVVPTYTWISPYLPKYNSILTDKFSSAIIANAPVSQLNNSSIVVYTVVSSYNTAYGGCRRFDTVSVHVVDCRPVRNVFFSTVEPNDTICTRDCITFVNNTDTAAGGPQVLEWSFEGGNPTKSNEREPTVCYNLPGKYYVILKVSNPYPKINSSGGAAGSALSKGILNYVKVTDIPNVTIVTPGQLLSDTIIRFGDAVNLNGSGALSYQWSPAYNISSLTKPKVTVNPYKTTQYILTGYNSKKCFSRDTINVIVIEDCGEMYVPNAFTPNNDGANDVLYVRGRCLQSLTFMVFNRWGEKVFETTDQSQGWDGTYKGEPMNTAVFVFRLEGKTYDGKAYTMKGNVTLIR